MADENPTGRGAAVVLNLPADQVGFLRGTFADAREGVQNELQYHPREVKDPAHLRREEAAYGRLLTALDECVIVPDAVVRDLSEVIDLGNEYRRVVFEHEALHECRHSYVTHLRAAGINDADLAEITGHRVETMLARYTHAVGKSFPEVRSRIG